MTQARSLLAHRSRLGALSLGLGALASAACSAEPNPSVKQRSAGPPPADVRALEPDPSYLEAGETRTFRVTYTARVKDIPEGTRRLRVWVPVPRSSVVQTIRGLEFDGAHTPELRTEAAFGNRVAYYELAAPGPGFEASYVFVCERRETRTAFGALSGEGRDSQDLRLYLEPERLVIVDDRIRALAREIAGESKGTVEKARALYEYVGQHMSYDKSGTGWGRGDTRFACDVGKGNCTDFHALFISLCRAEGIAAGFEIGLYLPYERHSQEPLGGYHCWAWFRVPGRTWVPVDISEADRFPERKEYFFGSHTPNRVTLSAGRDLVLYPPQAGEPLNFFLNPYAEADGVPLTGVSKDWTATDLDPER